jgi:hypothetical protein
MRVGLSKKFHHSCFGKLSERIQNFRGVKPELAYCKPGK